MYSYDIKYDNLHIECYIYLHVECNVYINMEALLLNIRMSTVLVHIVWFIQPYLVVQMFPFCTHMNTHMNIYVYMYMNKSPTHVTLINI